MPATATRVPVSYLAVMLRKCPIILITLHNKLVTTRGIFFPETSDLKIFYVMAYPDNLLKFLNLSSFYYVNPLTSQSLLHKVTYIWFLSCDDKSKQLKRVMDSYLFQIFIQKNLYLQGWSV